MLGAHLQQSGIFMSKKNKNKSQDKPEIPAIPEGWAEQIADANPHEKNAALVNRADAKHWNHVKVLLDVGADPAYQDYKAVFNIVAKGKKQLLSQMLDIKNPPEARHSELLEHALENRKYQSALILMDHGVSPDCYCETDDVLDEVLNAAELSMKMAAARGSVKDIQDIENRFGEHIKCSHSIFANAAGMHNQVEAMTYFLPKKVWPDEIKMFQQGTAEEMARITREREDTLQCFQTYYVDADSFAPFDASTLTQRPDEEFENALITLAAETNHFCNLVTGMQGNGYDDITPKHLSQKNEYGFNVVEALHKTGEIKQILDFNLWRNNIEAATFIAQELVKNNLTEGLEVESFVEALNKEKYRTKISHTKPTIMRRRNPKN